jgi:hypothetical protein
MMVNNCVTWISARLGCLWVLIIFTQESHATTLSDSLFYQPYPFIYIIEDEAEVPQLSDEQFFSMAAKVKFQVAQSNLPKDAPLLKALSGSIIPQLNTDSLQLVRMVFRGAASPEGSYEKNRQLGQQRVKALYNYITNLMHFPAVEQLSTIDIDIEDYRTLCLMMRRANDLDYPLVQMLCDQYMDKDVAMLKQMLKTIQGGKLWQRLLTTYFPDLRTARFVMVLRKVKPTVAVNTAEVEPTVVPTPEVVPEPEVEVPEIEVVVPEPEVVIEEPQDALLYRRELLAVKTNLLLDFAYMPGYDRWCPIPNVALEYYPKRGHFTYGFSFDMPWWQDYDAHKYFQLRNYQLETRYYLRPSNSNAQSSNLKSQSSNLKSQSSNLKSRPAFSGLYLQGYVHGGLFGICFDADRGWVGEGFGAGVGAGYVMPISRNGHWRLEFQLQAGFFRCKYDPYKYENPVNPAYHDDLYYYKWTLKPELFKKRQYRWNWLGPTRIGITLTYDLLYRRIHKRGMSFKSTERRAAYE